RHPGIKPWIDLIQKLGLGNYARIITTDDPIEDYVTLADVVVLPYANLWGTDGNPSCLLEALACGTPVVTTAFPELKEIAEGAVEFANVDDVPGLAEKLQQTLEQPDPRKIKKGLEMVTAFSPEIVAESMRKVYS
ncbi:MAG: glycosyltransferase, partial [Nanoarchaeota archaeon]